MAVDLLKIFEEAFQKREALASKESCLRVVDSGADGMEGVTIDRLGQILVCSILKEFEQEFDYFNLLKRHAGDIAALSGASSVFLWTRSLDPKVTSDDGGVLLWGNDIEESIVNENGLSFIVRPKATASAGFFIDMREVRRTLSANCSGQRVLNTFCYTGSLGIAAALGGAKEVVQVDSSRSALSWAKSNHELNSKLYNCSMRFIPEDVLTFMEREVKRCENGKLGYETIIIDPPAFGRSDKKSFTLIKEIGNLCELAVRLTNAAMAAGAVKSQILFTANQKNLAAEEIESILLRVADKVSDGGVKSVEKVFAPRTDFLQTPRESATMRGVRVELG